MIVLALLAIALPAPLLWSVEGAIAEERATRSRPAAWAVPIERSGLPNLHQVSPMLYRGAQPTKTGYAELKELGVRTVVNLRTFHADAAACRKHNLAYRHISMQAWEAEEEEVLKFLRVATDPGQGPVFVHCQHGADRTGMMVAIYRMVVQGWTREEAIREMTDGGFGFHSVWQNLVRYLQNVDTESLKRKLQEDG